ncbi:tryptophan synthase subunit beta [Rhodococcus ruber Chol-4]|uniref:TrpB-like pyridoxal phosphate-dependent enzyme n=1 Tax=Rhodococcus TaxID=1827 RepID=UPI00029A564B|nr:MULTISPECIES: TrpB-like pyridoxal phosphate-dependent enzyme [Rhodococcus]ATQ31456.1 TrpB-like pyridoxal phosphate-dependent enzyme [Rhodococcus ruber]AUM15917.1 TrpB-like pyridoxal phosphate-dependent enzyme [Rhodococcus ruber]AWG98391.1 TrpB-like pyridoxal phosphate-dependent enzyme [Rhodococcus ruber]KXF88152.1 tryptophan synthase subunit beta [Rhodococcus ruber Chol-4]MBD8055523.1 TrpB-like pyridoxal phosphate-dependent enzyme [Rhodococcus ruber]
MSEPVSIPTHWYNIAGDLPDAPPPHLHPGTREPVTAADLEPLFAAGLIEQELSTETDIAIPEPVREAYATYRTTPLLRARSFERALGTAARIYVKYEGVSPVGSHKTNSALAQAYYNSVDGVKKLTTETGAGQWGSALSFACAKFGIDLEVWQVRASYESKPYRRHLIEVYGGTVHSSPSDLTASGRKVLDEQPDTPGSLGIAVSEAVEVAAGDPAARYALGSVLNHVVLHQTVIGLEAVEQLRAAGEEQADVVFGCAGGGSNLAGLSFPFLREVLHGRATTRVVAAEPAACPSITRGEYRYDHGDIVGLTPLLKMHTLGQDFIPDPIHAGGLRYHGMAPLLSHTVELGYVQGTAVAQTDAFAAAVEFARTEGIVPAPESAHAIAAAAEYARTVTEPEVIVIGLSGHGQLDLPAYAAYLHGELG